MKAKLETISALLAIALALTLPRGAAAVDGVIEINQARALAGYVTATDAPGFPVTIDSAGSFRLTGNLRVGGTNGIELAPSAGHVSLDLNGFSIVGTDPSTTGVRANNGGVARISNGSILGFGRGISGGQLWIASVHIQGTGTLTPGTGIAGGDYSVVADSEVDSHQAGISVGASSVVRGCTTRSNGNGGIHGGASSLVSGNDVTGSIGGISVDEASTVIGNNVHQNNVGLTVAGGGTVLDNTVFLNRGFGIVFTGSSSGYARNVLTGNNSGDRSDQVSGAGIELGTNICGSDTVCP